MSISKVFRKINNYFLAPYEDADISFHDLAWFYGVFGTMLFFGIAFLILNIANLIV